jgi:hypothetical protein
MVKCIDIMAANEAEDRDLAPAQSVDEAAALASTFVWNDYMLKVRSMLTPSPSPTPLNSRCFISSTTLSLGSPKI